MILSQNLQPQIRTSTQDERSRPAPSRVSPPLLPGGRPKRAKRQSYAELENTSFFDEEPEVPRRGRGKGGRARSASGSAADVSDDVRAVAAGLRERKGAKKSYAEAEVDAYLEGELMEEDTGYNAAGDEMGAPYEVSVRVYRI